MAGQSRLEREAPPRRSMAIDLGQHDAAGSNRGGGRSEGGESLSDEIRVHEERQPSLGWQKLPCEGRLPRAVRPGDDDDLLPLTHDRAILTHA